MSRHRLSLYVLLWLAALLFLAQPAAVAEPAGAAHAPVPVELSSAVSLELGPIRLASGAVLLLDEQRCGTRDQNLMLTFLNGGPTAHISHSFSGFRAVCRLQRQPARVSLRAEAPGALRLALQITVKGRPQAHALAPFNCAAGHGPVLAGSARGGLTVSIDRSTYGIVRRSELSGHIYEAGLPACPAPDPRVGTELTAAVGAELLEGSEPRRGVRELQIINTDPQDAPAGLRDTTMLTLTGAAALGLGSAQGTVRLGAGTPFSQGTLSFSPLPACPGARAVNGEVSGTLTVQDPLLGQQVIQGAAATEAYAGPYGASAGTCNGPGSEPVVPELKSTCDQANAGCSLSAHTNTATLFDESSAGTQTITSESLLFGDGSAPVPMNHLGAVRHTYRQAGSYTATLSVTDATGATQTTTARVLIAP